MTALEAEDAASSRRVLLISGSLRAGSTNAAVLATAAEVAPPGVEATFFDGLARLPHFNPDDDFDPLPEPVRELRDALAAAHAVLFCTPEYAGALPGSFKNLLDWTIGGGEMYGKRVGWINVSGPAAPSGGADAHESLRNVLGYAGAEIVEEACVHVPVARSAVGERGIVEDASVQAQAREALAALASAP